MVTYTKKSPLSPFLLISFLLMANTSNFFGMSTSKEESSTDAFQLQRYQRDPFLTPVIEESLVDGRHHPVKLCYFNIPIPDQEDSFSCGYHAIHIMSIFLHVIQHHQKQTSGFTVTPEPFSSPRFTEDFNHFFDTAQKFLKEQEPAAFVPTISHWLPEIYRGIPSTTISEKALESQHVLQLITLLLTHSPAHQEQFKQLILQNPEHAILIIDPLWFFPTKAHSSCKYLSPDLTIPSAYIRHHLFSFEKLKNFQQTPSGQIILTFISGPHWLTCLLHKENQNTFNIYVADSFYHDLQTSKMLASIKAVVAYVIQHRVSSEEIDQAIIRIPS